jgi:hypothetical protein
MKKTTLILTITLLTSSRGKMPVSRSPKVAEDGLISDWIGLQLQFEKNTTRVPEIAYFRNFAYTGVAIYGAVLKTQEHRFVDESNQDSAPSPSRLFAPAAVNAAIAHMLRFFYGEKSRNLSRIDSMEAAHFRKYRSLLSASGLSSSAIEGRIIAAKISAGLKVDGASYGPVLLTSDSYVPWQATMHANADAAVANREQVKPIINSSTTGIDVHYTPSFSSNLNSPFYEMAKEVRDVGNGLTSEQKAIVTFWDDSPDGRHYSVSAHWFSILKQVLQQQPVSLQTAANAYLQLGISMNDAAIYHLMNKQLYSKVPPVSYVHKYMNDRYWQPFLRTPDQAEYIIPAATISSAAAFSLEAVFGSNFQFTDHSYDGLWLHPRHFESFEAAAAESGLSKLYAGIDYRPFIEANRQVGRAVAVKVDSVVRLPAFFLLWE